jgi:hypothetical protein
MLPQETRLPGYGHYNPHASYRTAGHPSALVGSFLATKGTPGGAYSSSEEAIIIHDIQRRLRPRCPHTLL